MELTRELVEFFFGGILLLIVFWQFRRSLRNRTNITLIDISVWITGTSFGLAPFVLMLYGGQFPTAELIDVVMSYLGILLFIAGLLLVKKNFKKSYVKNKSLANAIKKVHTINPKQVLLFYSLFFIVRIIFAFNYGIFGSGTATAERMQSLPYYLFVARSLLDLVFWGCIFWSVVKIFSDKKITFLPTFILLIEILLIFFRGRRQMLFFVFLFIYIYILSGYKINLRILFPALAIVILLVNIVFPAFISFREISLGSNTNSSLIENYLYTYYTLSQTGIDKTSYEKNIADRVYINTWNIDILSKSSLIDGLYGRALMSSILLVIPRPLLPGKSLLKDPETLINHSFGLELKDSPSNWPAYGFADFGLLGAFIYGIILGWILFMMQSFAIYVNKKLPFYSFIIIGSLSFVAFFIEEIPSALFGVLRDIIPLYMIFSFLYLMKTKNKKSSLVGMRE